jgi:hypothetical protein
MEKWMKEDFTRKSQKVREKRQIIQTVEELILRRNGTRTNPRGRWRRLSELILERNKPEGLIYGS